VTAAQTRQLVRVAARKPRDALRISGTRVSVSAPAHRSAASGPDQGSPTEMAPSLPVVPPSREMGPDLRCSSRIRWGIASDRTERMTPIGLRCTLWMA